MMMHVYNNILVPYDGSQPSHLAMQHAFSLTKMNTLPMTTKKLYLLYVIQEILVPPQLYSYPLHELDKLTENYIKELYQMFETKAMNMLKAKTLEYKEAGEIDISTHVLLGDPANKIIEFADGQKVDLIIMGSVGLRGIDKIQTLGSVSRRVSEMASCHVLIVH
jgi:nucleotide-binding universal stress UspA family protein